MAMTDAFIGLGSNLADPTAQLARAVTELLAGHYTGGAVGVLQQPPRWASGSARLRQWRGMVADPAHSPATARPSARDRAAPGNESSTGGQEDLDLLVYGDDTICSERLTVPHPELPNRDFVLQPLLDLKADLALPDGQTIADLRQRCPDSSLRPLPPLSREPFSPG